MTRSGIQPARRATREARHLTSCGTHTHRGRASSVAHPASLSPSPIARAGAGWAGRRVGTARWTARFTRTRRSGGRRHSPSSGRRVDQRSRREVGLRHVLGGDEEISITLVSCAGALHAIVMNLTASFGEPGGDEERFPWLKVKPQAELTRAAVLCAWKQLSVRQLAAAGAAAAVAAEAVAARSVATVAA